MTSSHKNLGLLLGFIGMCLFAGTLPATRLAISGFDPWFLTVARAALAGSAGLVVLLVLQRRVPPRSLWFEMFVAALHGGRVSTVRSACDDDGARRSWWRRARYSATRDRGRGDGLCPRAAEPRILAGERDWRDYRFDLHASPKRR